MLTFIILSSQTAARFHRLPTAYALMAAAYAALQPPHACLEDFSRLGGVLSCLKDCNLAVLLAVLSADGKELSLLLYQPV